MNAGVGASNARLPVGPQHDTRAHGVGSRERTLRGMLKAGVIDGLEQFRLEEKVAKTGCVDTRVRTPVNETNMNVAVSEGSLARCAHGG
jgi:hypothetical protein